MLRERSKTGGAAGQAADVASEAGDRIEDEFKTTIATGGLGIVGATVLKRSGIFHRAADFLKRKLGFQKSDAETKEVRQRLVSAIEFRRRSLELARDPDRTGLLVREGVAGARFEIATGRRLERSSDSAADFIDPKLGPIDVKGPLRANDGSPIEITQERIDGLANAAIEEANFKSGSRAVVVDTLDLSRAQIDSLKKVILERVTSNKPIIFLE